AGQGVRGGRRRRQRSLPVAGRGRDPRGDEGAGPRMRKTDRRGVEGRVRPAHVAAAKLAHHRDQPPGLAHRRRHVVARRGQSGGDIQIPRQQGRGEGPLAHAGLVGRGRLGGGQVLGGRAARALAERGPPGQEQAVGRAAVAAHVLPTDRIGAGGGGGRGGPQGQGRDGDAGGQAGGER